MSLLIPFKQVPEVVLTTVLTWAVSLWGTSDSVLFHMLFKIHMKSLCKVVRRFVLQCHQYADDI